MARGRKKEELLLEEKLKQALVPVEEQPYEVPGNWCWVRIENAFHILNGYAFKSQKYVDNGIRVIRIANVQDGYIEDDKPVFYPLEMEQEIQKYMLEAGDLLISLTGNVGRVAFLDRDMLPAALNQRVGCLRCNNTIFNKSMLFYYFLRQEFQDRCIKNSKGSAQLNMSTEWLKCQPIPLPPLAEQQRIVERIKSLFTKLDEIKEKVQEVVASIDDNVEALLYKAFTGQLTNGWRNSNIVMEEWEDTTLSEIVSGLKYGSSEKSDYEYKGTPVLRIPNIGEGIVDFSDLKYMSKKLENSSHEVFEDDILIVRSNGSRDLVGKCALVPKLQERYAYASFLIRMKVSERILPEYLVRFMNSSMARVQMFDKAKSSSGIHNINAKELGAIKICIPSIEEQKQILICIQEFINKGKKVQEISEEILGSIDRMKKSILAKAFRGELGTNNLEEESAIELLKRVLSEEYLK